MFINGKNINAVGKDDQVEPLIYNNEFLKSIIDASNEGVWVTGRDNKTLFVNQRLSEMLGYSKEEILNKTPSCFMEKEDESLWLRYLENARNGSRERFELKYVRKTGSELWASVSARLIDSVEDDHQLVLMLLTDITEHIKAAEKFSDSDLSRLTERRLAELSAVIEAIPDAVYIGTKDGITHCNTAALKMLGAESLSDLQNRIGELGKKFNVRWPDSGRLLREDELQFTRALRGETVIEDVIATNVQTGEDIYIRASDTPIVLNGEIIGAVAINSDITSRKKTEETLRIREAQLDSFFANSPVILNLVDDNFCYINTDKLTPAYYGLDRETIRGRCVKDLSPDFFEQTGDSMRRVIETGEPILNEQFQSPLPGREDEMAYWQISFFRVPLGNEKWGVGVISNEMTDIKRSENKLRESQERLKAIFDNLEEGLITFDPQGRTIDRNPAALSINGYRNAESKVEFLFRVGEMFEITTIDGKILPKEQWPVNRMLRGENFRHYPVYLNNKELGWKKLLLYSGKLVHDSNGKPLIGFLSVRDITRQKIAEDTLRESQERFRTLADNISQFAWMADADGSIFWYNKRWYEYTGTTFEEMKGWGWKRVHHPDHLNRVLGKFIKAIDTGEMWEDTFPIRGKDGSYRWYLSRALPIRDENNKIIRWFGTNTDITEQKLIQEKLHEALLQAEEGRNTLNAMMENIPMGITIADAPDVNIRMVSRYGQDLLEKSDEEIAGIPAPEHPSKWGVYRSDGITPGTPEELPLSRATMKGEVVMNEEWYVTRKDGTLIPILCNAAPILDNRGDITGGVIGWQDIGELKRIHKEMQQRNEELTRFVYTVSHDLKSPLITIRMFASHLKDDIANQNIKGQDQDLAYIQNAAVKMERLLNEILELSRIGRKEQLKSEVMLESVARSAMDLVAGRIREKNVSVKITRQEVMLYGYAQRLVQLYQNLLDNAVKFMGDQPSPEIEIGTFEDENKELILFVRDNGSGIDPKYHDKVFGLFEKLDPGTEGTGIGLALVKRIIEVHEGRIWFTSEGKGMGTTFFFTIEKTRILNLDLNDT